MTLKEWLDKKWASIQTIRYNVGCWFMNLDTRLKESKASQKKRIAEEWQEFKNSLKKEAKYK